MPKPAHKSELAHATFPHARRVRVPTGVRGHPGLAHTGPLACAGEELGKRGIGERLGLACATAAHEEEVGAAGVARALGGDIISDRGKRGRLMQVNDALAPTLARTPRGWSSRWRTTIRLRP